MDEPDSVAKRHLPMVAAIFMLCLGGAGLLISNIMSKRKKGNTSRKASESDDKVQESPGE
jgi:hypothetical protein